MMVSGKQQSVTKHVCEWGRQVINNGEEGRRKVAKTSERGGTMTGGSTTATKTAGNEGCVTTADSGSTMATTGVAKTMRKGGGAQRRWVFYDNECSAFGVCQFCKKKPLPKTHAQRASVRGNPSGSPIPAGWRLILLISANPSFKTCILQPEDDFLQQCTSVRGAPIIDGSSTG